MTMSARWGDDPYELKQARKARVRQSVASGLKAVLFAVVVAAMLSAVIAVRVFAYLPAAH